MSKIYLVGTDNYDGYDVVAAYTDEALAVAAASTQFVVLPINLNPFEEELRLGLKPFMVVVYGSDHSSQVYTTHLEGVRIEDTFSSGDIYSKYEAYQKPWLRTYLWAKDKSDAVEKAWSKFYELIGG